MEDTDCLTNELCDKNQLDYNGTGIGDVCECNGNFDRDLDVDGTDASIFKMDFGRSKLNNQCYSN